MNRNELTELARRALKLVGDHSTDMALTERRQKSAEYTDPERFSRERDLVMASPHVVGYCSELPEPGTYVTKVVMGRHILLTRTSNGMVRAFHNACIHRCARIVEGHGKADTFVCPYHSWTYGNDGVLLGAPGIDGFPQTLSKTARLAELPTDEVAGFLWVGLDPDRDLDVSAHLGTLADELDYWQVEKWTPIAERELDSKVDWKLAVDSFAENYHLATVHRASFGKIAASNCAIFDEFGHHHRLVFPMKTIRELADQPESSWMPRAHLVMIYGLFPNVIISVANTFSQLIRIYPGDGPGHSVTYHQNALASDLSDKATRNAALAMSEYAHSGIRDEDYPLLEGLQENLWSGGVSELTFGRNEPALHHRNIVLDEILAG